MFWIAKASSGVAIRIFISSLQKFCRCGYYTIRGGGGQDGNYRNNVTMRECLINAIRHGNADKLYVQIQKGNTCQVTISNNGTPPDCQIKEGGGLSSLRKKIQESGGSITFQLQPKFTVELELLWQ